MLDIPMPTGIDLRRLAQEWADEVAKRGGHMSINHPLSGDCSWRHELARGRGVVGHSHRAQSALADHPFLDELIPGNHPLG